MNLGDLVKQVEKVDHEFKQGSFPYGDDEVQLLYKTEMSVADYEYIFFHAEEEESKSVMSRRIVRMVRDADGSKFTLEDIKQWPVELVLVVSAQTVGEVKEVKEPAARKKRTPRKS